MPAKFPHPSDIPWDKIKEVKVSKDANAYSFEFDLHGKRQKITLTINDNSTTYTLSKEDGTPIISAIQKGKEIKVLDFTQKPSHAVKKLSGITPIKKK
ncbi:MAG: hypothetical protein QW275_01750 [Candidatus Anstonellaceae archaeon]